MSKKRSNPGVHSKSYRGNSMHLCIKPGVQDITRKYFDHPIWQIKPDELVPEVPLDIQIEMTNVCNLSCRACSYMKSKRKKEFLDYKLLKKIIDEAAEWGVSYFTFCGLGEASLHPNIFESFGYIRSKKVKPKGVRMLNFMPTVFVTNGSWKEKQIKECIENPPDLISFSLSGLTRQDIKERRKGINLDKVEYVISTLYNKRKRIRGQGNGLKPVIHISTHIFPEEFKTRRNAIYRFKNKYFEMADGIIINTTTPDLKYRPKEKFKSVYSANRQGEFTRKLPCMETSRRLSIASSGDVWCGHHLIEDFGPVLGNIRKNSLEEVWQGKKMFKFRDQVRKGRFYRLNCQKCGGDLIADLE